MITAMQRAVAILRTARAEVAKLATQDHAIPWALADLDRIIGDLDVQIESDGAQAELPIYVDFPMEAEHV